jgi:glycine C-acetyltransferase
MDRRGDFTQRISKQLEEIRAAGLWKDERVISTPQGAQVGVTTKSTPVLNMCANNYLGLANHPELVKAGKDAMDKYGYGMASVRFICGTQTVHKELEARVSRFLQKEDTILYSSCFDANTGLFETLLDAKDAIISDTLNHASIIDGVRLCKAKRFRYKNNDMADLRKQLEAAVAANARTILIATDGVFSMDGIICNLRGVCDLADEFGAIVMVDDSHAIGFVGEKGRGTPEHCGVMDRVHILTGTLGKALGGSSGGYVSGPKFMIDMLRQRSRPYLFSNTLTPCIAGATLKCLEMLETRDDARRTLRENAKYFRERMTALGFKLQPGEHPIIPVMIGDAVKAKALAEGLYKRGVYAVAFSFPVVPRGAARIRTQMSAAHSRADVDRAIAAFEAAGREIGCIGAPASKL